MPKYRAEGRKAVNVFVNKRDAWNALQALGQASPEESPALEPLRSAARNFTSRLRPLQGMPEGDIDIAEQRAAEAAKQLQDALNELSDKQPELYRQHAETFERAWQEQGLEIEGAAPQAQEAPKVEAAPQAQAQAPKAGEAPKLDFYSIKPGAFARYMTRALKNKGPELKALDELAGRMNKSKEKDKFEAALTNVSILRESINTLVRTVDTPEEAAGDYLIGGSQVMKLRRAMAALQKSDPKLFGKVFGPFVQAMEGLDFSKDQTEFTELQAIQNAAQKVEKAQIKQAEEEASSRKVTLYGNVELTENCGIHFTEIIRNDIINDPGFKKVPPSIDSQKLAKLIFVTGNTADFGPENPLNPEYKDTIETQGVNLWKSSSIYFEHLAKEPEVARLLSQREEGKTWFATSREKLDSYMYDVFNARYEHNRASADTMKQFETAMAEADDTLREYGGSLQAAGNKEIGRFAYALRETLKFRGKTEAPANIGLMQWGREFLDSIDEHDMEEPETRECLKATLKVLHSVTPSDEFAQICRDMNQRMGVTNDPAHKDYVTPEMYDLKDQKSGLQLIDDLKKGLGTDESARDAAAKIMAARILTNTKGGKASYLDIPISRTRMDQVAEALKGSESFNQWLGGLDKNKAARLLSGHGGDLEKSFKDHLKKLPAGELRNDPVLRRYMPTAKERIEELQSQAAKAGKDKKLSEQQQDMIRARAAAEIIAIRNACKVERGGAGLGKQIPPASGGPGIADSVSALTESAACRNMLAGQAVQDALQSGHGGSMMAAARTASKDRTLSPESERILYENTVRTRKEALRKEAGEIYQQLKKHDGKQSPALLTQSRRVLGEYAALVISPSIRNEPEKDMKWQAMEKAATSAETDPIFKAITASPAEAGSALRWVGTLDDGAFRKNLTEKMISLKAENKIKASDADEAKHGMSKKELNAVKKEVSKPEETVFSYDDDQLELK